MFCSSYCSQFKDRYHYKLFCCDSMKSAPQSLFTVFAIIPKARLYVRIVGCAPKRNVTALRNRSDDALTDCKKPNKSPHTRDDREARGASAHNERTEIVWNNEPFDGENMKSFYFCQPRLLRHRRYSKIPSSFHLTCLFIFNRPGRRRERKKKRRSGEHVYEV